MSSRIVALTTALALAMSSTGVATDAILDRIAALTRGFKGTVVLHAKNLETGREVSLNVDAKVRTASTIKLPILCALEFLVAEEKARWDERLVLRASDKVSGSGVMHELAGSARPQLVVCRRALPAGRLTGEELK